ncbi:MAG TPA: glycosyltransferase family 39 protein [Candidatus Polarisedimenticolaceae bacterium]|nr:glycosyltransferase family 39 protein [Candidatus Polarisedimenticolaceae bacterium]
MNEIDLSETQERRRFDWAVIALLLLLALATRGYGLGTANLDVDEYYTVYEAAERATGRTGPLLNALALASFRVFGVTEWTARLPSFVLGVITIPLFYATWRKVLGRPAAVAGALIVLVSGWHLWHSQYARYYAGVFLFGSLAYYFFYRAVAKDSIRHLVAGWVWLLIGTLFHPTSVLVAVAFAAYCAAVVGLPPAAGGRRPRVAKIYLWVVGVGALVALPFLWNVVSHWYLAPKQWGRSPAGLILQIVKYIQIPVAVSAAFGIVHLLRVDLRKGLFFACGVVVPAGCLVLVSLGAPARPDFLFQSVPLAYAAAGYLCGVYWSTARRGLVNAALTVVVLATMMPEFISHYSGRLGLHLRQVTGFLERSAQPGDRVLPFVSGIDHYSGGSLEMVPRVGSPFTQRADWSEVMDAAAGLPGRLWIVIPGARDPLAPGLETWLRDHAWLKWRRFEKRFDYTHHGYEVYLVVDESNE